ncbi:hypothetical protein [Nocardia sp. NPDC051750]|uniref:hypothetical protein n=1 Tax=Nocardia sp. NPDC051750 TaxID=3364325 RepID=UPI00378A2C4C
MAAIPARRRIRWATALGYLILAALATILTVIGLPGEREVLVFNDEIVSPADECWIIGGARGSCSDLGTTEVRYLPATTWLLFLGAANAALLVWSVGRETLRRNRYTVDNDLAGDLDELGQFAEMSAMGRRHDTFTLSRGLLVRTTRALLGFFENGLVICAHNERPRVYPWTGIADVRQGGKQDNDKVVFEFDLTFDDATVLRTECTYRASRKNTGNPDAEPGLRFALFMDSVNREVAALRGPSSG